MNKEVNKQREKVKSYIKSLRSKDCDTLVERIKQVKEAVQKNTGSYKYNSCYEDCEQIILKVMKM